MSQEVKIKVDYFNVAILTVSDSRSEGRGMDESGDFLKQAFLKAGYNIKSRDIVADDIDVIAGLLRSYADREGIDLVVTTGGTGFSPRDVTPEATLKVLHRSFPGISEILRMQGMEKTPFAILSRGVSGIRYKTIIINLPGSLKAVREGFEVLEPVIMHAIKKLNGDKGQCGEVIP